MDFIKNTRGLRNNNPGNIRHGNDWKGEKFGTDTSFETFTSVEYGIRAIFKLIDTYEKKYNARSIREIISRYAPSNENHTENYIDQVYNYMLKHSLLKQSDILMRNKDKTYVNFEDLLPLFVGGIILVENGFQPFNFNFIKECQKL